MQQRVTNFFREIPSTSYESLLTIQSLLKEEMMKRMTRMVCLLSGLLFWLSSAMAAEYHVSPTGTGTTCSGSQPCALQDALDIAEASSEDDVIRLAQGTYNGTLAYLPAADDPYAIEVRGGWNSDFSEQIIDPDNTVINGGNSGSVLQFNDYEGDIGAGDIVVTGVTVRNGRSALGGGIYALTKPPGTITISFCIVENNVAEEGIGGGCVLLAGDLAGESGSDITLNDNIIRNNHATGYSDGGETENGEGGGCGILSTGETIVANNLIYDNMAGPDGTYSGFGGGLLLSGYAGSIDLVNNTIADNTAEAVDAQGPSGNGGGIVVMTETDSWNPLSVTLRNCIVNNNQVTSNGSTLENAAGDISNAIVASGGAAGSTLDIDYCNYQALRSQDGAIDPLLGSQNLTAPPGFSLEMPYYLARSSVCVDAGDNNTVHMPATDLDGQPRPQDGDSDGNPVTNMGCYEQVFADPFPWNLFLPAITSGNE